MDHVPRSSRGTTRNGMLLGAGAIAGASFTLGAFFVAISVLSTVPPAAGPAPSFVEAAAAAGLDHTYDGDFTFYVGGGVAVFDCNDDGKPDLYLAGGTNPAGLYRNDSPVGGELRFEKVSQPSTDLTSVTGAYPIDIDADGRTDLAVLRVGENVVLRGTGNCGFERANEDWGIDGGDVWTAAFSATWEDETGLPTLVFGSYVELDEEGKQTGGCSPHALIRPDGDGGYAAPVPLTPAWCTLSILFTDWNRSGTPDLRVANDRHYYRDGEEQLWQMAAGEMPRPYTHEEGWEQMRIWGMGIASQDLTGDGLPEYFLTSQGDNKLQTLVDGAASPTYHDIALASGVTATRPYTAGAILPSTGWHPEFQDVNNDGYVDLYISKGNVEAMPEYASKDPNDLLLGGPDGVFTEAAPVAGIVRYARTRGAALADFNLDGLLDLVEVNRREPVTLWRNVGAATQGERLGNWLAIRLEQPGSNRDGIGSWIEVEAGGRTVEQELTIGGGHAGDQLGWIHFGLGEAAEASVTVHWPNGEVSETNDVPANSFVILDPAGEPEYWELAAS